MKEIKVKVKTLSNFCGELPVAESVGASGMDVRAQLKKAVQIKPGERMLISTGLSVEIPLGFEVQMRPRSGWALKKGLTMLNTPGTIDADYRGEIKVILANLGQENITIKDQDRIGQMVLCPVYRIQWSTTQELSQTDRGQGGFGSTGLSQAQSDEHSL